MSSSKKPWWVGVLAVFAVALAVRALILWLLSVTQ